MQEQQPPNIRTRSRWLRIGLPVVVLLIGVAAAVALVQTAPKAKRTPPPKQARLVEVETARIGDANIEIEAMGTVVAAQEVVLQSQVSGEVVAVSPELAPGGLFRAGEEILRIDPADYELNVRQKESELATAQSNLQLEQGKQAIARREYELLGETVAKGDSDLVLRKPQLAAAKAQVNMARAALSMAQLNLDRTRIRAPFNAIVRSRSVNVGTRVSPNSQLATLIGTDRYWIELAVPVDQLQWLEIPRADRHSGSTLRVYNEAAWGPGVYRSGRIIRLAGDLEEEGRMARLLVAVDDPLALGAENRAAPALLIDSYVRVVLEGRPLSEVVTLDRSLIRDGDQVWIMGEDDALQIRPVQIRFRGRDVVHISAGIAEGERIVRTDLAAPVAGMALRTGDAGVTQQDNGAAPLARPQ